MRSLQQQNGSSKADGQSAVKHMRPICGVHEYDLGDELSRYGVNIIVKILEKMDRVKRNLTVLAKVYD